MPSLTLTLTAAQADRLAVAVGRKIDKETPADLAEVKSYLIHILRELVADQERSIAQEAIMADLEVT